MDQGLCARVAGAPPVFATVYRRQDSPLATGLRLACEGRACVENVGKKKPFPRQVRSNIQECARTKTWVNGMALGKLGFMLRVTHPIYDNGQLKGEKQLDYIELGLEIGGLLSVLKQQTGNDFGLMMLKKFFKEEDWVAQRKLLKLNNNWGDLKEILLANNTFGKESIFHYQGDVTELPDVGVPLDIVKLAPLPHAPAGPRLAEVSRKSRR